MKIVDDLWFSVVKNSEWIGSFLAMISALSILSAGKISDVRIAIGLTLFGVLIFFVALFMYESGRSARIQKERRLKHISAHSSQEE